MILPLLLLVELHPYSFAEAAMITTVPPPFWATGPLLPCAACDSEWEFAGREVRQAGMESGNVAALAGGVSPRCRPVQPASAAASKIRLLRPGSSACAGCTRRETGHRDLSTRQRFQGAARDLWPFSRLSGSCETVSFGWQGGLISNRRHPRLSGPALLADAAADAVLREKFVPATLNGERIVCDLIVVATFKLF
jgi:hypothetical protein